MGVEHGDCLGLPFGVYQRALRPSHYITASALADIFLMPQLGNTVRFGAELRRPLLTAIKALLAALPRWPTPGPILNRNAE